MLVLLIMGMMCLVVFTALKMKPIMLAYLANLIISLGDNKMQETCLPTHKGMEKESVV